MIELSRAQDEEVGDGTTSVIILAGEILSMAEPWLEKKVHPRVIIGGYLRAMQDALDHVRAISKAVDTKNDAEMKAIIKSCIGTKFVSRWSDLMCDLALKAVRLITVEEGGKKEVDLKRYCRIEKIPGGDITESVVIPGVVIPKDVTHSKMRRRIENPRVILLDCSLEYNKSGNSVTQSVDKAPDWEKIMKQEEEQVKKMVADICKWKPDLVITEKGVSDEAQHWFVKHNVTALRRLRKGINNRIARATGATIVNRPEEITEKDVGTKCGLFDIRKVGDEYYTFITDCKDPHTATILLRGPSKDVLNEVERNIQDALGVTRNVLFEPRLCPGGGATEMSVATKLVEKSKSIAGVEQYPYHSVALAFEVIPRTLIQNCGVDVVKTLTSLRAKHASGSSSTSATATSTATGASSAPAGSDGASGVVPSNSTWGVNGESGDIVDMTKLGVWEPLAVKQQTIKTAIEAATMLLRIDDIVSGLSSKNKGSPAGAMPGAPPAGDMDV